MIVTRSRNSGIQTGLRLLKNAKSQINTFRQIHVLKAKIDRNRTMKFKKKMSLSLVTCKTTKRSYTMDNSWNLQSIKT